METVVAEESNLFRFPVSLGLANEFSPLQHTGQNYRMLIALNRGHLSLIYLQWRAKLLDSDWPSGKTYSLLIG